MEIAGIDHTLVGVADLGRAAAAWERLGFRTTPRGRHIGWGTANRCVMFADDYVELLGVVDPSAFDNGLGERLAARGEGLLGLAFAGAADAVRAALGPGRMKQPTDLARSLELPEGDALPRFRLSHPASPDVFPALSAFVCEHLTPELLRRPEWLGHPNGVRALEGVTVVAEDPAALAPAWAAVFGADALHPGEGRLDVRAGRHALRFLTPERFARRYPDVPPPALLPSAAVMTVLSDDLGRTAGVLAANGVRTLPSQGVRLVVPPDEATGVVLEVAAR
jgi:hypothetical protein